MPDPLSALIDEPSEPSTLLRQVAVLGDFQPGSISKPDPEVWESLSLREAERSGRHFN